MNTKLIFFILIYFFSISSFAQKNDLSKVHKIKKGTVTLEDRSIIKFRHLKVVHDSVEFTNENAIILKYAKDEIYRITKSRGIPLKYTKYFAIPFLVLSPIILLSGESTAIVVYFVASGLVVGTFALTEFLLTHKKHEKLIYLKKFKYMTKIYNIL